MYMHSVYVCIHVCIGTVVNQSINNHLIVFKADKRRNCDYIVESIVRSSELEKNYAAIHAFVCTGDKR